MMKFARAFLLLSVLVAIGASTVVQAATITWFGPQTITGNSDVKTNGTLFQASNFGSTTPTTVNGVAFSAASVGSGSNSATFGNFTIVGTGTNVAGVRQATVSSASNPYAALSSEYKSLLGPFFYSQNGQLPWTGSAPKFTISLNNLTVSQQYDIQFWVNDPRATASNNDSPVRQVQIGDKILSVNTTQTGGGVGQWILGTFVADSTTQSFDVVGVSTGTVFGPVAYANAMQVRAVPEPSTLVLAAAGALSTCLYLRNSKLRKERNS